ncbi:MAG: hypothetical protein K1X78_23445 [Verrucomicrobiaceae bacterium]|nr:hypothetical protein [Verrucomicrobiaceae bacterium]
MANTGQTGAGCAFSFTTAASRVLRRVILRRWITLLGAAGWVASGVLCALSGLVWCFSGAFIPWLPLVLLCLWMAGSLVFAYATKPGAFPAFALWDQAEGRREAFATAWWFEQQAQPTPAQSAHVVRQQPLLREALPRICDALPIRPVRAVWAAPVVATLALALPAALGTRTTREIINDDMSRAAGTEGRKLARQDWEKKKLDGLDENEKKALEKLKDQLKNTARELENSAGKDARSVLSSLEKRAREAEKLASDIGQEKNSWASAKMVEELRRHADTADLGDAVAEKNARDAAAAAETLARQLKSQRLTTEARERLNETLKDVQKLSEKEDRTRTVGENVLGAADRLLASDPVEAGDEFEKLADKMRDISRRELTRKELEKLAQQLRDAGANITGQSEGTMRSMTQAGQQGGSSQAAQSPQVPQSNPQQGQNGGQPLMPPGFAQNQQQGVMSQSPSSGTGQQLPVMTLQQPGNTKSEGSKPMLVAPVPGMKPPEKPDAILISPESEKGDPNAAVAIAAPGGLPPGEGKADLNNKSTKKQGSGTQSMVTTRSINEGQSTSRAVEGGARKEQASRGATSSVLQAIQNEEEALDEQALPPSRREQVRRYFTELRKRFEKQE